jgi:hypothetical protein
MSQKPPSLTRVALLLVGSTIAGMVVSSWLLSHVESRLDRTNLPPEQSLVVEVP